MAGKKYKRGSMRGHSIDLIGAGRSVISFTTTWLTNQAPTRRRRSPA